MNIILSSGKVGHYYNLALTLQRAGYLQKFITTSYFKNLNNNNLLNKSLIKISRGCVYSRFNRELDSGKIKSIFYPEVLKRFVSLLPLVCNGISTKIYNYLFDLASCRYIDRCDIFLVAVSYGFFSAKKAKNNGALVVLDMVSAHPKFYIDTLKEEAKRFNIPIEIEDEYYLEKMQEEFQLAEFILVPSTFVYKTMIKEGIEAKKMRIIPYGVDIGQFSRKSKKDSKFRLIFIGGLTIRKGIQYLLKAYKELNLRNSELLLIGKTVPHIRPILKEYAGCFKHIPVVPHPFLNEYYSNSSVFILPSIVEGSALVIYEAMACGLPVIITENCGAIARDGKDGFVIPIRDVEALKEKILFFYKNGEARIEMGRSARRWVEKYSWQRYQEELTKNLQEIIKLPK